MENEESHAVKLKLHNIVPSGFDGKLLTELLGNNAMLFEEAAQRIVLFVAELPDLNKLSI